ncbi:hypothetical protein FALBO_14548 [Fusarium albosuccineum]|uniref:Uncharacterized protein n=1 Tax=Fusarium albosuccineum TaxID=1237068 RepID=A0A8H4L0A2_9HYPO|nr:hypothetical protein FALBO_14548 [Fusarium albosuccineum]
MLLIKVFALALATVATAIISPAMEQLAANLGVPAADIEELLSTTDVSCLDITKYTKALQVKPEDVAGWTESLKTSALEQLQDRVQAYVDEAGSKVTKRQQSNREKVQAEVDELIGRYRSDHEKDHRRRLSGCPSDRCTVCAASLTAAYVAALAVCGAAAVTEEAISSGFLAALAITQLGTCVTGASGVYTGGWSYCLGMTK